MVVKELFPLQNVIKKLFEMHYSSKKLSASPKNGNSPDKENNASSLTFRMSYSFSGPNFSIDFSNDVIVTL